MTQAWYYGCMASQMARWGLGALLVIAFLVPYNLDTWWKFFAASAAMLVIGRWLWREGTLRVLGLAIPKRELVISGILTVLFAILVRVLVLNVCTANHIVFDTSMYHWGWKVNPIAQVLNEEIVFRALLLAGLVRFFRNPMLAATLSAVAFAAAHWVLYSTMNGISLPATTLTTLFAFGMASSLLFLRFGHIGYSCALHLGWNLTKLEGTFINESVQPPHWLHEGEGFVLIEGAPSITALSLVLFAICLWLWYRPIEHRSLVLQGNGAKAPEFEEGIS